MGENGAGKSTLMNIVFGMPFIHNTGGFNGEVLIENKNIEIKSPKDAMNYGIGMVHQEFMLLPGFTITENIKLNREILKDNIASKMLGPSLKTLDIKTMRKDAKKALNDLGMTVDDWLPIAGLPVGYMQFVEIARENHLIIYADEIYDRLVYDNQVHTSIASLCPDLFCVTLNGLSKSHRIAGFRSGWMILSGDKRKAKNYIEGLNLLTSMRLCSNVPAQQVIQTALGGYQSSDELIIPGGRLYEQRETICSELSKMDGISFVKPKAAFYIFPKIDIKKFNIKNDEKFILDLLKKEHILMVQGTGFNWKAPDHFRIVFLPRVEDLKKAMQKLGRFLSGYKQI
jgi:ABC-type lipoprotein export system ATPase subunit